MGLFDTIKGLVKKKDDFAELGDLGDLGDLGEIGKEEPAVLGQEMPSAPSFEPSPMAQPSQPQFHEYSRQIASSEMESLRAKLDVISSKLDTIKVQLDSLNQRISMIENSVRPSAPGQRYY